MGLAAQRPTANTGNLSNLPDVGTALALCLCAPERVQQAYVKICKERLEQQRGFCKQMKSGVFLVLRHHGETMQQTGKLSAGGNQ